MSRVLMLLILIAINKSISFDLNGIWVVDDSAMNDIGFAMELKDSTFRIWQQSDVKFDTLENYTINGKFVFKDSLIHLLDSFSIQPIYNDFVEVKCSIEICLKNTRKNIFFRRTNIFFEDCPMLNYSDSLWYTILVRERQKNKSCH